MRSNRYLLNHKNTQNSIYNLLYINKSEFDNGWHSIAHFHPFTEVFVVTNGQGSFHIDNVVFNVEKWDLIIINPNCLHTENSFEKNNPLEYIVLGIDNFYLNFDESYNLVNNENSNKLHKIVNISKIKDSIYTYLNSLIHETKVKEYNYEVACKSILNLFMIQLVRNIPSLISLDQPKENLNLECLKIKNYIDSHYCENITLDLLSNLSFINKFHLVHTFTKQIGVSPINYVISKRIDESKTLLTTTNYSIMDISLMVGFSNSSYFSQMFKKITGISPKHYRIDKVPTSI